MGTGLEDRSSRRVGVMALENLDNAVCLALANVENAHEVLCDALAGCADTVLPAQVRACVEAAEEHAAFGEWREARMLLTVAHRLLSRGRRAVAVPAPSTPGDVIVNQR
ncbi:hypothetical protein SAMN05216553_1266 [Lentzea fradiae]|uniref:Uncharacterized protein n=1 Tax=Lentzea fradiae TaxID=200378 RepID=A0A1G8D3D1_9PSEU|nr:hypothetical protein [Lentzea fradiae]SDH52288.1 hypothetical protein SAMN05216553_1266 [Lentzea fradiae]